MKTVVGMGSTGDAVGSALQTQLRSPKHIVIDAKDNVLIADEGNARNFHDEPEKNRVAVVLGKEVGQPSVVLS